MHSARWRVECAQVTRKNNKKQFLLSSRCSSSSSLRACFEVWTSENYTGSKRSFFFWETEAHVLLLVKYSKKIET